MYGYNCDFCYVRIQSDEDFNNKNNPTLRLDRFIPKLLGVFGADRVPSTDLWRDPSLLPWKQQLKTLRRDSLCPPPPHLDALGLLPRTFSGGEAFGLNPLLVLQEVPPLAEVPHLSGRRRGHRKGEPPCRPETRKRRWTHPLSGTFVLEVALLLLAGLGAVVVVVQALPQEIPGVPADTPLCGVWSRHPFMSIQEKRVL